MSIPFERLGIPEPLRRAVASGAPKSAKLAVAKGLLPTTADVQLALLYVLAADADKSIAKVARETLVAMPNQQLLTGISQQTFPKILEFLAEFRPDDREMDDCIVHLRSAPTRAIVRIAQRANKEMCEVLARHQERLLLSPVVFVALHANEACSAELLQVASSFLRMHNCLPDVPSRRPFEPEPVAAPTAPQPTPAAPAQAASSSPATLSSLTPAPVTSAAPAPMAKAPPTSAPSGEKLEMFSLDGIETSTDSAFVFDFEDDMESFSWDLTGDEEAKAEPDEDVFISMEKRIADMTVGQKIKLAYLGNKQARTILIRDSNKVVASAVVKSGRLTDNEVASIAGNRNLPDDVLREISSNKGWTRKYPVKVALVNNPKTPVPTAIKFIAHLNRRELHQLSNNHNVASVISGTAKKLFKEKYRK